MLLLYNQQKVRHFVSCCFQVAMYSKRKKLQNLDHLDRWFFGPTHVGVDFVEAAPSRLTAILRWLGSGWEENDGNIRKFKNRMLLKHPCQAAINKKQAFQPFEALRHLVCTWHFDIILWIIHYDLSQWTHLPICNSKAFCLMGPGFPLWSNSCEFGVRKKTSHHIAPFLKKWLGHWRLGW